MTLDLPPSLVLPFTVWVALVGAAVGSFLNVVVARLPAGESVVRPGSRCPRCKTPIRWYDNVPVLSWLALRARCRACGARISFRYPLVEAAVTGVALAAFWRHGPSAATVTEFAFVSTLLALALIDLDTWLLPHALTWPLIASGLLLSAVGLTEAPGFRAAAYGAGVGFASLALIAWLGEKALKKEALGMGDVWLVSALGAWMGMAALLPIVLLASMQGSIIGLALIAAGRGQPGPPPSDPAERSVLSVAPKGAESNGAKSDGALDHDEDTWVPPRNAVPFGPFLVAGALEWLYLGSEIVRVVPALEIFR